MSNKLQASEIKVMNVLWREGECTAKHVSDVMTAAYGWNINTTYTLIKRCIAKGAVERREPNFLCRALVTREAVQRAETEELIDRVYEGSAGTLCAALLGRERLTPQQLERLRQIVRDWE